MVELHTFLIFMGVVVIIINLSSKDDEGDNDE